jgi:hypothetical protein
MSSLQSLEETVDWNGRIWIRSVREDLPQQDSKGPNVAFRCVELFLYRLQRHPLHRQSTICCTTIVLLFLDVTCRTKVGDLQDHSVQTPNPDYFSPTNLTTRDLWTNPVESKTSWNGGNRSSCNPREQLEAREDRVYLGALKQHTHTHTHTHRC